MPSRSIYNNNPSNLKVQIYGSDSNQPIITDEGAMAISGTVEVDTTIPLSVNVVEITPIDIAGIVTVTVDGTPTVNTLPVIPTVSTVTIVTGGGLNFRFTI